MKSVVFDLELFEALNAEYVDKPLQPRAPSYVASELKARGNSRVRNLAKIINLSEKRVLEIGCGRGEVLASLTTDYGCRCVGVDVSSYDEWDRHSEGGTVFLKADLTQDATALAKEKFDLVVSYAAWEHIVHPYSMLVRAYELLESGGEMYFTANLHRGPKASHRYREVFFPWPHLLFQDDVFEQFYLKHTGTVRRASWVNHLTAAHYLLYFEIIGFQRVSINYQKTPIDENFYSRFEDVFSRYPRFDLERDFIKAHLRRI